MDRYVCQKLLFKVKSCNDGFVSYKHAAFHFTFTFSHLADAFIQRTLEDVKLIDWSHVDYMWIIVMFLSVVWTLILTAPIYYR